MRVHSREGRGTQIFYGKRNEEYKRILYLTVNVQCKKLQILGTASIETLIDQLIKSVAENGVCPLIEKPSFKKTEFLEENS